MFCLSLNKCLRRSIFPPSDDQCCIEQQVRSSSFPGKMLFFMARCWAQPGRGAWSFYFQVVWLHRPQLTPPHPAVLWRGVLGKQANGEKEFKCWALNQCLHFQVSTDGLPVSACTYIRKKLFQHAGFVFSGALQKYL